MVVEVHVVIHVKVLMGIISACVRKVTKLNGADSAFYRTVQCQDFHHAQKKQVKKDSNLTVMSFTVTYLCAKM